MTRYFTIVLRVTCDDDEDDPRRWPWDEMLAPPDGDAPRHVKYVLGVEEKR